MKEANSELLSGLIVVVAVAILVAFFYFTVWPLIDDNFKKQTSCDKAVCTNKPDADGYVDCTLNGSSTFKCPYKG